MHDQVISEKTLKQDLLRQKKLYYSLKKIDSDDFGLCVECEEEIMFERLLLLPESTHCIDCLNSIQKAQN